MLGLFLDDSADADSPPSLHYRVQGTKIEVIESKDNLLKFFSELAGLAGKAKSVMFAQAADQRSIYLYLAEVKYPGKDFLFSVTASYYTNHNAEVLQSITGSADKAKSAALDSLKNAALNITTNRDEALRRFEQAKDYEALAETFTKNRPSMIKEYVGKPISERTSVIQNRTLESFSFSLAYAIKDPKQITYDKDNGIVTAKDDSKPPTFLTINYYPGGVEKRIKDQEMDKALPAPLWTPFHVMAGFRTDITEAFEPMLGAGVGMRIKDISLNLWAGASLHRGEELTSGNVEGEPAQPGQLTNDKYDVPFMWGVSISWKP